VTGFELDSSAITNTVMKFRVLYKAWNISVDERLLAFQGGLCFMKLTEKLFFLSLFDFIRPSILTCFTIAFPMKAFSTCFAHGPAQFFTICEKTKLFLDEL
jgi:hypothetical protein